MALPLLLPFTCIFVASSPCFAVGKNLTYLSQLDGLTFQLYRDVVLPR